MTTDTHSFKPTRRSFLRAAAATGGSFALAAHLPSIAFAQQKTIPDWTTANIPAQTGRSFVVTGATSGMGYEDALALARAGAHVIIASRNKEKGDATVARIRGEIPDAQIRFEQLDLADLRSVADFAARLRSSRQSLDTLINNAAVMAIPKREVNADGHEMQLATNYLGHFALTGQLLPLLRAGRDPRVVNVSSVAAARGAINFDDLQWERGYEAMQAYSQTKLANLLFTFELERRSRAAGWGVRAMAAHPGISRTELLIRGPGENSEMAQRYEREPEMFQSAAMGALPTLFAATSPDAQGGMYYGPREERRGLPAYANTPPQAKDEAVAARLWQVSERLTRVRLGTS